MLQVLYGFSQGVYWMTFCSTLSFASSYITSMGYTTTQLGIMVAIANVIAAPVQQIVANAADRAKKITLAKIMVIWLSILALSNGTMSFLGEGSKVLPALFMLSAIIIMLVQPLENALAFRIEGAGKSLNFGLCRSMGSVFFSIVSSFLGWLAAQSGTRMIPRTAMVLAVLYVVTVFVIDVLLEKEKRKINASNLSNNANTSAGQSGGVERTLKEFLEKYKYFFIFLVGTVGFTFGHIVINNYIYQITANVGGNDVDMGRLLSVQAIVELPTMALFANINKRFKTASLIKFAAIFFVIKNALTLMAGSLPVLYFAMLFQMLAFAMYIPASVKYVNDIMDERDAVKGQSFVTVAYTISSAFAAIFGGVLIDNLGVTSTLLVCLFVAIAGMTVSILSLNKYEKKKD